MVQALLLGDVIEIIAQETSNISGSHDFWTQLGPGSYTFDLSVSSSANRVFSPGTATAEVSYDFEYTIIVRFVDLNNDDFVNLSDLAQLLSNYGTTSGASYEDGDLEGDGDVDLADLAALLAVYGTTCK